ncbi:MAG: acetoacetate decarboxylase [Nevskia sp.]|nr:acetoacetate decarboxylase [Nevskia sp.]
MLKGYTVPLTPRGEANLVSAPPWHYSGDVIAIEFWAAPEVARASLPPGLTLDEAAKGHTLALFADWQFTAQNDEHLDPARYQYREFYLMIDALYGDTPVSWCPFMFVDNDSAMVRGLTLGCPKKLGSVFQTRTFAAPGPAAAPVASGTKFGVSVSAHGQRLADGRVTLHRPLSRPPTILQRPIVNRRYFPRLTTGYHDQPAVDELTMVVTDNLSLIDVWAGSAELVFPDAHGEELCAFEPKRVGSGYRLSVSCSIRDLKILEDFTATKGS